MQPTRIGIIGCGVIARYHARALAACDGAVLHAVADVREESARKLAAEFSVTQVYGDPHRLLADPEIDAVILAFYTQGRTEMGLAAFRAGKHVLTEKPAALNAAEIRQLISARGRLVGACCSSRHRFTRTAALATEFIAAGKLGQLRTLRCRALNPAGPPPAAPPPAWRMSRALNGGGIFMNWGCYDLDFLLGVTGWSLKPRYVHAVTYGVPAQFAARLPSGSDAEAHVLATIGFADHVILAYERGECYPGPQEAVWEVTGSAGTLTMKMTPQDGPSLVFQEAPAAGGLKETVLWSEPENWDAINGGPTQDFVGAIRTGRPPRTTFEQALIFQQIADAVYESAASGRAVEIADGDRNL